MDRTPFERLADLLSDLPLENALSDLGIRLVLACGGLVFELDGEEVGLLTPMATARVVRPAAEPHDQQGWREIDPGDLVLVGDRIRNPYGEEQQILDVHDGGKAAAFGDGDIWTVTGMAEARDWEILKGGAASAGASRASGAVVRARGRRQAPEDALTMISSATERIAEAIDDERYAEKAATRMLERRAYVSGTDGSTRTASLLRLGELAVAAADAAFPELAQPAARDLLSADAELAGRDLGRAAHRHLSRFGR